MNFIGGYFELETRRSLDAQREIVSALASGRSSLRKILLVECPALIHVPFYCCEQLLAPIRESGIPFQFYHIGNNFQPVMEFDVAAGEWIIAINFFGISSRSVDDLVSRFGSRVIIDNSQAIYAKSPLTNWSFTSIRKWFGIPDGSVLSGPKKLDIHFEDDAYPTPDYLDLRRKGRQQEGYQSFLNYEQRIDCRIRPMSAFARELWSTVDLDGCATQRRKNYQQYHLALGSANQFNCVLDDHDVPFFYPLLPSRMIDRRILSQQGIFVPQFWSDVLDRDGEDFFWEKTLSESLLPLPVDHRYGSSDIRRVIMSVQSLLNFENS